MVINRSHNRVRIPQLDTFSSNGFDSIKIAKCAIFSTNCPILFHTRALFLRGCCAKDKNKQNSVRNYFRRRWVNSISVVFPPWIWGKTLRITSSTITPNLRTVNVILMILITVVRVFLTNPDKKRYRKCREMNIPIGRNKKNLWERGGWKRLTWQQKIIMSGAYDGLLIMSNFAQIHLWIHDKFSGSLASLWRWGWRSLF